MGRLQLAASNIGWQPQEEERVLALMKALGFTGLEAAPTRLVGDEPYTKLPQAARAAAGLAAAGFCIPSLQSIWFGQTGSLFSPQDAPRLAEYTGAAARFAAAVGCRSLVFGCPRQRVIPPGGSAAGALPFFTDIAARAARQGVAVALEANPRAYGTNFCNTSAEAFAFARQVPGLMVNYDLGTLLTNGETLDPLFENLALVSHIHLSEPGLAPIEPRPLHRQLAARLRAAGYEGFVSVEMKAQPFETARRVLEYTAEVFG